MAHLPEGWESDHDGTRWFYRYTPTGLTQYHFPRPGDEFPELVGLGFGPLSLLPQKKLAGDCEVEKQSALNGLSNSGVPVKSGGDGRKTAASTNEGEALSATGYFDPDDFRFFSLNDVSPVGDRSNAAVNSSGPLVAELPEESVQSPVGFVAELASSETAKCAEELAPIELDAMQIAPVALNINIQHNGPAELPTHRSPVEQKQPVQNPTGDDMQPVEEYPLVSASFAYPPLKTANKPVDNGVQQTNSPHAEQKVLASERPAENETTQNKYETWKPAQSLLNEEVRNESRQSMTLSSISVLQSQNSELGPIEQKRHSLSGPVESSANSDLPGILRQPSDPRKSSAVSTPSPKVEHSPIPAVLQPTKTPLKMASPQDISQNQSTHSSIPPLPGSGARHESISLSSGPSVAGLNSASVPPVLKPSQNPPNSGVQPPVQVQANDARPGAHRVNTLPNQLSSQAIPLPKLGGPGIYVFQEIPAAPISTPGRVQNKPQESLAAKPSLSNQNASLDKPQQSTEHSSSIMNEPLPAIAPLSVSKPQTTTSTDNISMHSGFPTGSKPPNPQHSPVPSIQGATQHPAASSPSGQNSPHSGTIQTQGSSGGPVSTISQGQNAHQSQVNHPAPSQGLRRIPSTVQHKLLRKPLLPQRPDKVSVISETVLVGSASTPIHQHHPYRHGTPLSTTSNLEFQGQPHRISSQPSSATPGGQQSQALNQRPPSVPVTSPHLPPGAHAHGQPPTTNIPNSQVLAQGSNHGVAATIQISGGISLAGKVSNHPQAAVPNPQSAVQRPPSNLSQRPPSTQPAAHMQRPSQNGPAGVSPGQNQPHISSPPTVHPVSPLQSQVSSPTTSIASLHRPPSSASSHSHITAPGGAQNRPPSGTTHQSPPPAPRPPTAQAQQTQGNPQSAQSPNPPVTSASKPFPMLPGQVKPMPSQVGSPPIPIQAQPVHATPAQAQQQTYAVSTNPPQQYHGSHQTTQVLAHRPPQQQNAQGHHTQPQGNPMPGQPQPGTVQHGQPRPPVQLASGQQHMPIHPTPTMQIQCQNMNHSVGQFSQPHNGHPATNLPQGAHVQSQVPQMSQYPNAANPATSATQPSFTSQPIGQGQQQQFAQASGSQSSLSQTVGQGKPSDSAQTATSLSDAGKKMKKWAKKTWKNNPALKQTTAAFGGAIIAGSLGGNEVAGAALATKIYNTSQVKPQNGQPQRPPGPQHAHTAAPQAQHLPGTNTAAPQMQAMNRPHGLQQQNTQPIGVQTPGRPAAVQNPGMIGTATNNNASQQQPGIMNQRPPNQIQQPPVRRPPIPQMQQPAAFNQPVYQAAPGQPMFQAPPSQPLYQMRPNQPAYQVPPGQQPYQAQGGPDPYAAIGATIGGALNAIVNSSGGKTDAGGPAGPQQHHTSNSEQHQQPYYEQNHATHSEPSQEANAQSHQDTYADQGYTDNSEQNNMAYSEDNSQPQSDQQNTDYSDPAPADNQIAMDNSTSESYFAPESDTTINNNTIINNVDNTAIAQSSQMNYMDNSNTVDTTNMNMDSTSFADASYGDTTNTNINTDPTAFTDSTYTDTPYMDMTGMNMDSTAYAETGYMDSSYTDPAYMDATYVDTTATVDVNVDMSMGMDETAYMGDQTSMMTMDDSVSVDAYADTSTVDYSGGDWGGDW
ncbi:hypothetical protein F5Y06DRAFT_137725 [Hypoxylon sp. FL0890]|nr:hypothetical protein F5Y06DRAFT_137725 [Hypoxylon sp. FL0890]